MTGGFGLGSILQTLQQGVQAINNLTTTIKTVFPQVTGSSTRAPSTTGSITFTSSEATMFQLVTTSSGFTGKVPVYPQ
jgi:hypothetical protein